MSSLNPKKSTTGTDPTPPVKIPTDILLSLATGPVLLGVLSLQAISSSLQTLGLASEEVFRGDRLPVLPFPESVSSPESESTES